MAFRHIVTEHSVIAPKEGVKGTSLSVPLAPIGTRCGNAPRKMCQITFLFCKAQIKQKPSGHQEMLLKEGQLLPGFACSALFCVRQHFPGPTAFRIG